MMTSRPRPFHLDRRYVLFAVLYFSEGAPMGFIWWALPTRLKSLGTPLEQVTALSALLVLPWTFKFLWAPLVDAFRGRRWTLKHWIVSAQLAMAATLVPLTWIDWTGDFEVLGLLLFFHALAAATQDVAIDALCIASSRPAERGRLNGWMQSGMLSGRALFGGGTLVLVGSLGQAGLIAALVSAILLCAVVAMAVSLEMDAARDAPPERGRLRQTWRTLLSSLRLKATWRGLAFALVAAAGFEAFGAVQGPLLIDHGLSEEFFGWLVGLPMVACMLGGSLAGGYLADRIGHRRLVGIGILAFAGSVTAVAWLIGEGPTPADRTTVIALYCAAALSIGVFVAASYALLMDLCDPRIGGTQFSAFMGATNGCEAWAGFTVGLVAAQTGYGLALSLLCAVSLASLALIPAVNSPPYVSSWSTERTHSRHE